MTLRDPNVADPCKETPASFSVLLKGREVEAWVYRQGDVFDVIGTDSREGAWCSTPATDSSGTEIFELRRWIAALALYPRIARGTVNFTAANAEGGPATHYWLEGSVQVERDPQTLAPLGVPGRLTISDTWSSANLQALQFWFQVFVPELYGITCTNPTPGFSDTAAAHAVTQSGQSRITLKY